MTWIALRMLTVHRLKYGVMVGGVALSTVLIGQQLSIFSGIMLLTASQVRDVREADIWVMDPNVQFIDDIKRLREVDVYRVRGVEGVEWAVPLFKGLGRAQLDSGEFFRVILLGVDDGSLVGAPRRMLQGSVEDLRRPDAIIIDEAGYRQLWPGEPVELGRTLEMNDQRAVVVGICEALPSFYTFPIVYTRYNLAMEYVPQIRRMVSFVLARSEAGERAEEVTARIERATGLRARTKPEFVWQTMSYFLRNTGVLVSFAITVTLGLLVGILIAGYTFYLFTVQNLVEFGTLKALGVRNRRLVGMIVLQSLMVGLLGYGIGIGFAVAAGDVLSGFLDLTFFMPWPVLLGTGVAVVTMLAAASMASILRVVLLEPAIVFRG